MRLSFFAVYVLLAVALVPCPLNAQFPDAFTNLQVFDEDVSRSQLRTAMRQWNEALGVECHHCHVANPEAEALDFAADDKPAKQAARRMLQMTQAINQETLAGLATVAEGEDHQEVTCYTCHHGVAVPPRNIRVELSTRASGGDFEDLIREYETLREQHEGAGRYDFSAQAVWWIGMYLNGSRRAADAVKMFEIGIERFPESAELYAGKGVALFSIGDIEAAETAFEKALSLDPTNRQARRGRERVKATGSGE